MLDYYVQSLIGFGVLFAIGGIIALVIIWGNKKILNNKMKRDSIIKQILYGELDKPEDRVNVFGAGVDLSKNLLDVNYLICMNNKERNKQQKIEEIK